MPDPSAPPRAPDPREGAGGEGKEPLFHLASRGEFLALASSLLLLAGGLSLATQPLPGPAALPVSALLVIAFLGLLQAISGASALGKFLMAGTLWVAGIGLGPALWAMGPGGLAQAPALGATLTFLGGLAGVLAMEALRREAGVTYGGLARRSIVLAQEPSTQVAALKFLLPWALVGLLVIVILDFGAVIAGKYAAIFVQYFFNPVGKEVAILCGIRSCPPVIPGPELHPLQVAPFLVFIDAVTALFLAWNYRYILRVPFLGHTLRWIEHHGAKTVAKRAWIRKLAFTGVMLYAAGPFEGTGAIGGTIVGRTIGLDAGRTWGAVVSGSVLRTTLITLGIVAGIEVFQFFQDRGDGPQALVGAAVVVAAVVGYLVWRRRRAQGRLRPAPSNPK